MSRRRRHRSDSPPPLLASLKREFEALVGHAPPPSPEERLIQTRNRRVRGLRAHTRAFVIVNGFMVLLWATVGLVVGSWFPWFVFPLLGWGMGYTFHAVGTRAWLAERQDDIARAEKQLGLAPPQDETRRWAELRRRCEAAVRSAHEALAQTMGDDGLHEHLESGHAQTVALLDGAERLDATLAEVVPGGMQGLRAELARVEGAWSQAEDPGLRSVHAQNRALLQARREKIEALMVERDRIAATVESFVIAADNLKLDALRLGAGERTSLQEPVQRLQDELEVLERVRRELVSLESGTLRSGGDP